MKVYERRMGVQRFEFREESRGPVLEGYASTFDEPYDMGWYMERVAQGAFSTTLGRSPDVRLLINHDGLPLARTTSGTLALEQDGKGLAVRAELDAGDPDVASLLPKMKRGDISQMSFGFRVIEDDWSPDYGTRTLRALDLNDGDVSVVTFPANPGTSAAVRADGRPSPDAIAFALRTLERRAAPTEEIVSVLTRALGYFTAVDTIVDAAQDEIAEVLGIPNPDEDEAAEAAEDLAERSAAVERELLRRRLLIAG